MIVHRVVPLLAGLLLGTSMLSAQEKLSAQAATQHPNIYVEIKGQKQGAFPGDAISATHKNEIAAWTFAYEVTSPRDSRTGLASGKRQHKPVVFTHDVSVATPHLFTALVNNEVLSKVTFTVSKPSTKGEEVTTPLRSRTLTCRR